MNTITYTATARPDLFQRSVQSLSANRLDGWQVHVAIEPGKHARSLVEIARSAFPKAVITVNAQRLGVTENPFRLLQSVFATGSGLNLYLEDDLLVAPDAVELAGWFGRHHRSHWLCLNLLAGTCGSAGMLSDQRFPQVLFETSGFNSLGFALRAAEWKKFVEPVWMESAGQTGGMHHRSSFAHGWDWSVYKLLAHHPELRSLQPALARANHLPSHSGTFATPEWNAIAFDHLTIAGTAETRFDVPERHRLPSTLQSYVRLQDELTAARRAVAQASAGFDERVLKLENSASWRLTAPLRHLKSRLGRGARSAARILPSKRQS